MAIRICGSKRTSQDAEATSALGTIVITQDQKQRHAIGHAKRGSIMARAAIKKVANAEIRAAKSFLERRGIKSTEVSPRKFAMAAKELDKGFQETLQVLARELSGGQV